MRRPLFGPGILLAATSIGASHILMSPEAGARFGFRLVWLIVAAHAVKYLAFAFAPRYVAATGRSLLDAYREAPGPRGWAIWLGLGDMTVQALGLIAALIGLSASFLQVAAGGKTVVWALLLAAGLLLALRAGQYRWLRAVNLGLVAALAVGTLAAFFAAPPDLGALRAGLMPSLPNGSLLLVAAILGFMPTSVAVSVWQSLWAIEHRRTRGEAPPQTTRERLIALRQALFDLRVGYLLSLLLAVLFVSLGATLLAPRGLVPSGPEVAVTLAQLYTLALGAWTQPVFLAVAFSALLSTCYTMMDGFPRAFAAAWRLLRSENEDAADGSTEAEASEHVGARDPLYWRFLLMTTFGGMAILTGVPDPTFLVEAVGAIGLLLSPVYFTLNLWAVTRRIDDPALRPGRVAVVLAIAGIAFMTFTAVLLVWTTFVAAPPTSAA